MASTKKDVDLEKLRKINQNYFMPISPMSSKKGAPNLSDLPKEIFQVITTKRCMVPHLDQDLICNLRLTCQKINQLISDNIFFASFKNAKRGNVHCTNTFELLDPFRFPNLRHLELRSPTVSGDISFGPTLSCPVYKHLKSLTLDRCEASTDLFLDRILQNNPQLENLSLLDCPITGSALELFLAKYSGLKQLKLNENFSTIPFAEPENNIEAKKPNFPNLREISLEGISIVNGARLIQACANLTKLELYQSDSGELNGGNFNPKLSQLRELLIESSGIADADFSALAGSSRALEKIQIFEAPGLTRRAWINLDLSNLKTFIFACWGGECFHSENIAALAKRAPSLRELSVICEPDCEDDPEIHDGSEALEQFEELDEALEKLEKLTISKKNSWSDRKLINLIKRSSRLKFVSLGGFFEISDRVAHYLIENFSNLKEVELFSPKIGSQAKELLNGVRKNGT